MGNLAFFSEGSDTGLYDAFCVAFQSCVSNTYVPPIHQVFSLFTTPEHGQYNQNKPPVKSKEHVYSSGIRAVFIYL